MSRIHNIAAVILLTAISLVQAQSAMAISDLSYEYHYNIYSGDINTIEYPSDGLPDIVLKSEKLIILAFDIVIPIFIDGGYENVVLCAQHDGSYVNCTPSTTINNSNLTKANHNFIQGDFDGDGNPDLLLQGLNSSDSNLFFVGDSTGQLGFQKTITEIDGNAITADLANLTVTDLNNDGRDELLINGANPSGLYGPSDINQTEIAVKNYLVPNPTASPTNANQNSSGIGATAASFDVSPTGKPLYSIPLSLPPSVLDVAPDIALVYSGQDSNDFIGVGWYLQGLSVIERCQTTLAQDGFVLGVNFLANDKYCINGQRLKLIGGTYGSDGAEYRTENESFTKIVSYGSFGSGPSYFKVWKSTGEIELYGASDTSKRTNKDGTQVVAWAISELKDRQDNTAQYTYLANSANGEHYIDEISFNNNSVKFNYESRDDAIVSNEKGAYSRISSRLKKIITYVADTEAHSYTLNYEYGVQTGRSRLNSIVECAQENYCLPATTFRWDLTEPSFNYSAAYTVTDAGRYPTGQAYDRQQYHVQDVNKDGRSDLVWTYRDATTNTLGWVLYLTNGTTGELTYQSSGKETGFAVSGVEENDISFMMADINGDGRSDLVLALRHQFDFYRSIYLAAADGKSFSAQGYQVDTNSEFVNYKEGRYLLADANADGRKDLVWIFITENKLGYILYQSLSDSTNKIGFARAEIQFDDSLSPLHYENQDFVVGDVNGDTKDDIVWLFTFNDAVYRTLFLANGAGNGFYRVSVQRDDFEGSALETVNNHQAHLGDINGDNKADLIFTYEGENALKRRVYRSSELGTSFEKIEENIDTQLSPDTYSESHTSLADLNGDGHTDLLYTYVKNTNFGWVSYIANLDGSGFTRVLEETTPNPSAYAENIHHLTGDINADGKTDLLWAYNTADNNVLHQQAFTLPTSNPDHITSITDGLGNIVSVHYTYLSQTLYNSELSKIFTPSTSSNYPIRDDIGLSYVVDHVERSNGLGAMNTWDYRYKGAKTHLLGRGFLGFEQRIVKDNQTQFYTEETFLQDFPYIGLLSASETFDSGTPITLSYNHWKSTPLNSGKTTFRYLADNGLINYELDGSPISASIVTNQYDTSNGNLTNTVKSIGPNINSTLVRNNFNPAGAFLPSNLGSIEQQISTTNLYLNENIPSWRIGFLSKQTVDYAAAGEAARQVVTEFTPYNNTGFLVDLQKNYVSSNIWSSSDYDYDTFGNVTKETISAANADNQVEFKYYTPGGLFLDSAINGEGHQTSYDFNPITGSVTSETDHNGRSKVTLFDGFNRLVYTRGEDKQETNWVYSSGGTATHSAYTVSQVTSHPSENILLKEWQEYDALGREVRLDSQGFDSAVVRVDKTYDARGRLDTESLPYYTNSAAETNNYQWDDLDRLLIHGKPDGSSISHSYVSALTDGFSAKEVISELVVLPGGTTKTISSSQYRNSLGQIMFALDAHSTPSEYRYDSQGNMRWIQVDDNASTQVTVTTDVAGNKTQINDPDAGSVTMSYNGFGKVRTKTHGTGTDQVSSNFSYDNISRLRSRTDTSATAGTELYTWLYDNTANSVGQLTDVSGPEYFRKISYDIFGRIEKDTVTLFNDASPKSIVHHYNGFSQPEVIGYPSGLAVKNSYNARGFLTQTEDYSNSAIKYRTISAMDSFGNVTSETMGNGLTTSRKYRSDNGYIEYIKSGASNSLQNYSYSFDTAGNLNSRSSQRPDENITESFTYDNVHRLKSAVSTGLSSGARNITYDYDNLGNIKTKSDISDINGYAYGMNGAGVHGISAITKSGQTKQYDYDSRGNATLSNQRAIEYNAQNNPSRVTAPGNKTVDFKYSPDNTLASQTIDIDGQTQRTLYYHNGLYEITKTATDLYETQYLGGYLLQKKRIFDGEEVQYLYRDHLGSLDSITDQAGVQKNYKDKNNTNAPLRMAFDPWGKRRYHNWESGDSNLEDQMISLALDTSSHGFTNHLSLDSIGLIHMGGRIYDPENGRFLSPDFYIQSPFNSQSYNRYSYVLNNPLSYTDPSGEFIPLAVIAAYRIYSAYDTISSGADDFKTAIDSEASTFDRSMSVLSLGASAILGSPARHVTGKVKNVYKARKATRPEAVKVSKTKQTKASGSDKNTQTKADSCQGGACKAETTVAKGDNSDVTNKAVAGKITGYTKHGLNQALGRNGGRGVSAKHMLDAVKNPKKVVEGANGTIKYQGKKAAVVLNSEGKVITTFGKSRGPQIWQQGTTRASGSGSAQRKANEAGFSYNPKAIR